MDPLSPALVLARISSERSNGLKSGGTGGVDPSDVGASRGDPRSRSERLAYDTPVTEAGADSGEEKRLHDHDARCDEVSRATALAYLFSKL